MKATVGQDRFYEKKWGILNHFLYGVPGGGHDRFDEEHDWDARVNKLNVEEMADTIASTGAGYYFITLMQGRKFMLAPNFIYDEIAGTKPGESCATRDVVMELAIALEKRGVDMYLYYTGDGPYKDVEVGEKFGYTEPRNMNITEGFVKKWAAVLEEYSIRYGTLVKGWWIDGCYDYFGYTDELIRPLYEAAKKGNPDAIVSCNKGVFESLRKGFSEEEFVCGEFNDFTYIPEGRFVDGAQAHILAPLGIAPDGNSYGGWRRTGLRRDAKWMADYINRVYKAGGVVTIDIYIGQDGSFDMEQIEMLREMKGLIE